MGLNHSIGRRHILDRRRKWMLGRKPVVDAQHPRAGHVGNPPGKIAKQRRKAEQIGAAVQVHNVSVWKRAGRGDPLGFDTAGVNYDQLGSARRGRHEMREAGHPSTDILDLNIRWKPWPHEPRQAEADKLGAQTHLLKPPERTRSRTSSSAGGRAGGRRMPSVEGNKVTNGDQCAKLALVVDVARAVAVEGGLPAKGSIVARRSVAPAAAGVMSQRRVVAGMRYGHLWKALDHDDCR
jgi:hypothetical protein